MKQWGLVAVGSASRSFLPRIPTLRRRLGPVASTSHRLASRIANSIRAGYAAREIAELDICPVILLCAPGGSLERATGALAKAPLEWKGKTLLLCDSGTYTCALHSFMARGIAMASINPLEGLTGQYVIEGDRGGLREARALLRELRGKGIEIASDRTLMFDAARTLAGSLFTPLIETCAECIRQAGITGPAAAALAEGMLLRSLRAFMHSGRKSWAGHVTTANRNLVARECLALASINPLMARYFQGAADVAFELYQTFPELTRYDAARRGYSAPRKE